MDSADLPELLMLVGLILILVAAGLTMVGVLS